MTTQNFETVFQKISLSLAVQEAFQGTEVRKLTIHKKERTVSMEIAAKQLIPLQKWEDLRGASEKSARHSGSGYRYYIRTGRTKPQSLGGGLLGKHQNTGEPRKQGLRRRHC